jgi:uncharacterized membrane protein YtjA (UPF0391 family)
VDTVLALSPCANFKIRDGTGRVMARCTVNPLAGTKNRKENAMLGWALTFLIIALVAAALGFTGIAGAASSIAQILFVIFLVLFLIAMLARALQGRPPV